MRRALAFLLLASTLAGCAAVASDPGDGRELVRLRPAEEAPGREFVRAFFVNADQSAFTIMLVSAPESTAVVDSLFRIHNGDALWRRVALHAEPAPPLSFERYELVFRDESGAALGTLDLAAGGDSLRLDLAPGEIVHARAVAAPVTGTELAPVTVRFVPEPAPKS